MTAKGTLINWVHGHGDLPWGTSPDEYDPEAVRSSLRHLEALFGTGRYFRLDFRGWGHVPPPPVLVVSNHSGGTTIPDAWGLLVGWYRHFGVKRPIHVMAHEMILSTGPTGRFFGARGVVRASREIAWAALHDWGRDVLVMPGGDQDTWRPYRDRYQVVFGGRTGYARLALEAGVPILPVAHAGAHETLRVLYRGTRLAEALGLHRIARARVLPVHVSVPWGLTVGPWPHLPLPSRLRFRFGPAIPPPRRLEDGEHAADREVADLDRAVRDAMQALLDQLREEDESDGGS